MTKPAKESDENDKKAIFPSKYLIKICVPVDITKKSWIDNACALDPCMDMADAWNKECKSTIPEKKF